MTERASFYASLPDYYKLEKIRALILSGVSSEDIISFIKENKLSVNSYIKGLRANEWVPILSLLARTDKHQLAVKFLVKSGVNINLVPDADPEQQEPLLFTCDMTYFKFFNEHGAKITGSLDANIKRKLRCADIKRVKLLIKTGHLTVSSVVNADTDPILYTLTSMKDYLTYAFNIRQNLTNLTEELDSTVIKFLVCVEQLVAWGCPVSQNAVNFCIDYYLHEFLSIKAFNALKFQTVNPEYHEYKDKLVVAMLRPLLNDSRYEKTCRVLNVTPNRELYQKIKI